MSRVARRRRRTAFSGLSGVNDRLRTPLSPRNGSGGLGSSWCSPRVADVSVEASPRHAAGARTRFGVVVVIGVLLATAVGAGLVLVLGGDGLVGLGLPDPGLLTRAGLPVVRVLSECAAVVTVGSLLLATSLVLTLRTYRLGTTSTPMIARTLLSEQVSL